MGLSEVGFVFRSNLPVQVGQCNGRGSGSVTQREGQVSPNTRDHESSCSGITGAIPPGPGESAFSFNGV